MKISVFFWWLLLFISILYLVACWLFFYQLRYFNLFLALFLYWKNKLNLSLLMLDLFFDLLSATQWVLFFGVLLHFNDLANLLTFLFSFYWIFKLLSNQRSLYFQVCCDYLITSDINSLLLNFRLVFLLWIMLSLQALIFLYFLPLFLLLLFLLLLSDHFQQILIIEVPLLLLLWLYVLNLLNGLQSLLFQLLLIHFIMRFYLFVRRCVCWELYFFLGCWVRFDRFGWDWF